MPKKLYRWIISNNFYHMHKMLSKAIINTTLLFSLPSVVSPLAAQNDSGEFTIERHVSLDSGYVPSLMSNYSMANFNMEFIMGQSKLIEALSNTALVRNNGFGYLLQAAAEIALTYILASPTVLSYHELGHATRFKATGLSAYYAPWANTDPPTPDYANATSNYYAYFFNNIVESLSGNLTGGFTIPRGSYYDDSQSARWNALASMGGVNNSTFMAETISDTIYRSNGHTLYFFNYLLYKYDFYNYVENEIAGSFGTDGGDLTKTRNYYKTIDADLSFDDMRTISLVTMILSSGTISYFTSVFNKNVPPSTITPLEFGPIRYPEFSAYLTTYGPSIKMSSGYRLNSKIALPFSFEYVFKGKKRVEGSLSFLQKLDRLTYELGAIVGMGIGGFVSAAYQIIPSEVISLWVKADIRYYDINNLHGERHTPDIRNQLPESIEARLSVVGVY